MIDREVYESSKEEVITGLALYNSANIKYEGFVNTSPRLTNEVLQEDYGFGFVDKSAEDY